MKFSITTLGCKINQFDAGELSDALLAGGATMAADGERADLHIIQTCTVTNRSDYQCRQAIRRAVKEKPDGGRVVVTGCYAQTRPGELMGISGVDLVVSEPQGDKLPALLLGQGSKPGHGRLAAGTLSGRSRAFLKVQEGCDSSCSYCIVPKARGASMSSNPGDALVKAQGLIEAGYREIVLTGVHLGSYGKDAGDGAGLAELVERLLGLDGLGRIRLSSIEPMEFDERLMRLISEHAVEGGRLCRHFHVPLQSADDAVLSSMGRGYRWEDYLAVTEEIHDRAPGARIGADVIVGYPAEDDDSFEMTYERIAGSPLSHLHVFSYSPRPGTAAYGLGDPVPGDVKKKRSARLRALAARKSAEFRRGLSGKTFSVVVEEKDGVCSGLTDNYVRVVFDGGGLRPGSAVNVRITGLDGAACSGVPA